MNRKRIKKSSKKDPSIVIAGAEHGFTENSKPIVIHHIEKTNIANIVGIIISLMAALLSGYAISISDRQFELINQGYLDIEWHGGVSPLKDTTYAIGSTIKKNEDLKGMNLGINLLNVGNIPLTYDITKFDIYYEGKLVQSLNFDTSQSISRSGIIYPKQKALFDGPTIYFDRVMRIDLLNSKKISVDLIIKYNDLNNSKKKILDRSIEAKFNGDQLSGSVNTIRDKV